mgnify:CR=1 FL=1
MLQSLQSYRKTHILDAMTLVSKGERFDIRIIYNYSPKGSSIVVDIYRDAKRGGIYPPLFTDPEGDSCFSVYQIRARLFKRRLTANPGLNRLNLRLNFNLRLVRLFEGKVMLIPG